MRGQKSLTDDTKPGRESGVGAVCYLNIMPFFFGNQITFTEISESRNVHLPEQMGQNVNERNKSECNQVSTLPFIAPDEIILPCPTEFAIICCSWKEKLSKK